MALDPEEFRRRREEKEAQRAQQQKKTTVKLMAAGIVLALCAVIIVIVVSRGAAPSPSETTTQAVQLPSAGETAPSESTAPTQPPTTVIRLAAAGDLNVNDALIAAAGPDYDFSGTFLDVAHLLADADISVLNFEGVLWDPPYGQTTSAPATILQTLGAAGVDLLQLANSCSINQGMSGLHRTITTVRSSGIEPLGVFASDREFKESKGYTIRNVAGIRIAFVAFTKGMDGLALPPGNEDCVNLLYTDYASTYQEVDRDGITQVLNNVQKEKPDLTVALLHWGSEFNNTISASQQEICSLMQENGVDAIIGTHSHYVQQMTLDPATGNFVAYSLGDFCSDAQRAGTEYSVVLELEITKDNTSGATAITGYSYTPIFSVAEEGKPLKVVRLRQAMAAYEAGHIDAVSQKTYEAMQYALTRIEARIAGE